MKIIDPKNWKRSKHYAMFTAMSHPHFSVSADMDITAFMTWIKEEGFPFYHTMIYAVTTAANGIPEFRQRIRGDMVVEHDLVHPSFTFLKEDDLFDFATVDYSQDLAAFVKEAGLASDPTGLPLLEDDPEKDDMLFFTCLPWINFTQMTHPIHDDSFPRMAWGKYIKRDGRVIMPFNIQAHHALVDGVHAGKLYTALQEILDNPAQHLYP